MIQAIFFDFDDTLFSHSLNDFPDSTKFALRKLREKGIMCVLCTGRHRLEIECFSQMESVRFDAFITLDGQLIYDGKWNILSGNPLSGGTEAALIDLFHEKRFPVKLVEKDRMFINRIDSYVIESQASISTPVPDIGECGSDSLYQAVVYVDEKSEEELFSRLPDAYISRWSPYGVDVVSPEMTKARGIDCFLLGTGITSDEIMTFGDGENDIPMMEHAGTAVAMGNAEESVKLRADYVTSGIDDDGVYNALCHFGLI